MISGYFNKALFMIILFNGCFSTDFACKIFKQHFSQKGIFTEFLDAP